MVTRKGVSLRGALAIGLQWLMLTLALAAVLVHSEATLQGFVSPHIDGSFFFVAAFVAGVLMGMTVSSVWLMSVLLFTMGLAAATIYAVLIISPTLVGTMGRAEWAENLAMARAFWIVMLMLIPAGAGGMVGRLLGDWFEDSASTTAQSEGSQREQPWWERRDSNSP